MQLQAMVLIERRSLKAFLPILLLIVYHSLAPSGFAQTKTPLEICQEAAADKAQKAREEAEGEKKLSYAVALSDHKYDVEQSKTTLNGDKEKCATQEAADKEACEISNNKASCTPAYNESKKNADSAHEQALIDCQGSSDAYCVCKADATKAFTLSVATADQTKCGSVIDASLAKCSKDAEAASGHCVDTAAASDKRRVAEADLAKQLAELAADEAYRVTDHTITKTYNVDMYKCGPEDCVTKCGLNSGSSCTEDLQVALYNANVTRTTKDANDLMNYNDIDAAATATGKKTRLEAAATAVSEKAGCTSKQAHDDATAEANRIKTLACDCNQQCVNSANAKAAAEEEASQEAATKCIAEANDKESKAVALSWNTQNSTIALAAIDLDTFQKNSESDYNKQCDAAQLKANKCYEDRAKAQKTCEADCTAS